jgi:hypothetical protein
MSMKTCVFLILIMKKTLVLMCLASHFDIIQNLKIDCWASRHILCEKKLNTFVCVEARILVEK